MTALGEHHTLKTRRRMSESKPKRPVISVDIKTHVAELFESTRAAQEGRGWSSSNIVAACKGRLNHVYGRYWRYLDEGFDSAEAVVAHAQGRPSPRLKPVVMIAPESHASKAYPSIKSTEADGFTHEGVMGVLLGRCRTHGGMYWRYAVDFKSAEAVIAEEAAHQRKVIRERVQRSKSFMRIDPATGSSKTYKTAQEAEKDGFVRSMIYRAAKQGVTHGGYLWTVA